MEIAAVQSDADSWIGRDQCSSARSIMDSWEEEQERLEGMKKLMLVGQTKKEWPSRGTCVLITSTQPLGAAAVPDVPMREAAPAAGAGPASAAAAIEAPSTPPTPVKAVLSETKTPTRLNSPKKVSSPRTPSKKSKQAKKASRSTRSPRTPAASSPRLTQRLIKSPSILIEASPSQRSRREESPRQKVGPAEGLFVCSVAGCDKQCTSSNGFSAHINKTHPELAHSMLKFPCPKCPHASSSKRGIQGHLEKVHGITS